MKHYALIAALSATTLFISSPIWASSTLSCPDLSQASQITDCPSEDNLQHMFKASCGLFEDNANAEKPALCNSYEDFKRRKNTSLWGDSDSDFMGYQSCAIPASTITSSQLISMAVTHRDDLYRVSCHYQNDVSFSMRSASKCELPGLKSPDIDMNIDCSSDPQACKVVCD
ncbi:MAG: hypothetical protein OQK78_11745 [Gammaproteobacteria bacterium]|nr:hypothetical protein [Gammaproteobacteria bacterium]